MPNSIRFGRPNVLHHGMQRATNLPPITAFTMMAWVKAVVSRAAVCIAYGTSASNQFYGFGPFSGVFNIYRSPGTGLVPGSSVTTGRWYHMAMVVSGYSPSPFLGYLNGVLDISTTGMNSVVTGTHLNTGNDTNAGTSGDWFNGNIAAIKIYNRVLDAGEIAAEMPYALPVSTQGLNSAYPIPSAWDAADSWVPRPKGALTRWADFSGNNSEWTENETTFDTEPGPPIRWAPPRSLYKNRPRYSGNPSTGTNVLPGVGVLTVAGFAPSVVASANQNVLIGTGVATLVGFAPTAGTSNNQNAAIGLGVLTLAGFAPVVITPRNVLADVGAGILTGFAPSIAAGTSALPGVGAATLTGFAPTPSVTNNKTVLTGVGVVTISGFAPSILAPQTARSGVGVLVLIGFAPVAATSTPPAKITLAGEVRDITPVVRIHVLDITPTARQRTI